MAFGLPQHVDIGRTRSAEMLLAPWTVPIIPKFGDRLDPNNTMQARKITIIFVFIAPFDRCIASSLTNVRIIL
jgi:hypothetical protein